MKLNLRTAFAAAFLCCSSVLQAQTAIPDQMSYQATITDDAGAALNGEYEVTMRIFGAATGGASLWSEKQVVQIAQGRFSLILGEGAPVLVAGGGTEPRPGLSTVFSQSERFVEITVQENVAAATPKTLAPRQKLVASATAFRASVAEALAPGAIPIGSITAFQLAGGIAADKLAGGIASNQLAGAIDASKLGNGTISNGELAYLNGVTSGIQGQLNGKANLSGRNSFKGWNIFNDPADGGFPTATFRHAVVDADNASHPSYIHLGPSKDIYWNSGSTAGRVGLQSNGGIVTIGPATATDAKLVIEGAGNGTIANAFHALTPFGVGPVNAGWNGRVSVRASDNVAAIGFLAFSDARIKAIEGTSNGEADLITLKGIEITDYTYKNHKEKGNRPNKKVIAQQVESVFPQAISKTKGVVPDIYQMASLNGAWVGLATDLKVGERVQLISEKGKEIYEVLEVDEDRFRTAYTCPDDQKIFVFGRAVDDYRIVDYEAISMLNVSATQEILRRLEAKEKEVEELKAHAKTMDAKLIAIEKLLSAQAFASTVSPSSETASN